MEIPPAEETGPTENGHSLWHPSADGVMAALPGSRGIVVGDSAGHVHVLSSGASLAEVRALDEDVSFVGHTAEVVRLGVHRSGALVASAATDNTVRVWDAESGQPYSWTVDIEGDSVDDLVFSPDAGMLAVLNGTVLDLFRVGDGSSVAKFEFGELRGSIAFVSDDSIYVGGDSGILRVISRDGDGAWTTQQLWQGDNAIRLLAASPSGRYLVLVDEAGFASQLILSEGRVSGPALELPGAVEEIAFGYSGARAYFRTARWTHRVSLGVNGLHWVDSVFSPKPLNGARIVFGPSGSDTANRAYLPAAGNGFIELVELGFPGSSNPGLFGNREELLAEWRQRLGD